MTTQEIVDRALAALTPERLRAVVEQIGATQSRDDRNAVNIGPIMDALTGLKDLGPGTEAWDAYLKLRQAIRETVAQTPGLRYIEADA
jgi:hypothetical protein